MINSIKVKTALNIVIALYIAALCVSLYVVVPRLTWDPALTLKLTDNEVKGIPFNHYAHPNPHNLQDNQTEFVTWWTPGQYALPMFFERVLSVKLVVAIKILTGLCLLIAGMGIFKLFKILIDGDGPVSVNTLAVFLFVLIRPFFYGAIVEYDGGGVLMLAYCPWFIYWITSIKKITALNLALLLIAGFAGFFLKASFTCFLMAAIVYLLLSQVALPNTTIKTIDLKKTVKIALLLGLVFVIYYITVKVVFLDNNRNISNSSTGLRLQPRVLIYPIVAPILALFSLDSLNNTFKWLICSVAVIPVYYLLFKSKAVGLLYKYLTGSFLVVFICFFTLLYTLNIDVSYEPRHFVIPGILLAPGIMMVLWVGRSKYLAVSLMILFAILTVIGGVKSVTSTVKLPGTNGLYSGLHLPYSIDFLTKIYELDNANTNGNDIFYFQNSDPSVALEIRKNRVLFEDNFVNFHFDNNGRFKPTLYYGYNLGNIYIIYPQATLKQDSAKFLTRFDKYKNFQKIYQSKGYAILKALPVIK
jgi:hypothetical protein